LVGLLALWFLVALFQPPPFDPGEGDGEVVVTVPEGASADQVADILTENDVVSNGSLFQLRLRLAGKSESVGAGRFVMSSGMSYGAAIERLTQTGGKVTLTVPEGLPRDQIAPIAEEAGIEGDYIAATEAPPKGFNPSRYGAPASNLEGFLFPATYELEPNAPGEELVSQQLEAFEQNFAGVDLSYAKKKNLTPYDVLIIASMVDREVQVPKERALVAAVIYNRLSKGMPLGIDATTRYETKNYTDPIQQSTFEKNTPYNTRLNAGLTPTPIGNPGLDAIKAAARPAKTNFTFYVVKPGSCGEHSFTASQKEFDRLAAEYQRALEAEGGSPTEC
ncbi:MAG: endolytic transglycosylase MltG, partial [Solirubrobacterales bacterium]